MEGQSQRFQRPGSQPAPDPVTRPSEPATTGETVTVACKMPSGIFLRAFEMVEDFEPVLGGGVRKITRAVEIDNSRFVIRGTAMDGNLVHDQIARVQPGGFALTYGVPKWIWDSWFAANKNGHMVRNGLIFACASEQDARQEASRDDRSKTRSGLEPIDPDKPHLRLPGERLKVERAEAPNR